jgi:hypothetical protein
LGSASVGGFGFFRTADCFGCTESLQINRPR